MARIRTIKPEFWTSEQVMECSAMARLMFIGLWNFCDDGGRMPFKVKTIKAQIFPSDDISSENVRRLIDELSANALIALYVIDATEYLQVTGWHHQKIDKPNFKFPDRSGVIPENRSANGRRSVVERSPAEWSLREGKGVEGKGREGSLREGKDSLARIQRARARESPRAKFDDDWPDDYRQQFADAYPHKVGMAAALEALETKRGKVTWRIVMDGIRTYTETKPPDRQWANPKKFIEEERWNDKPAATNGHRATRGDHARELARQVEAREREGTPDGAAQTVGGARPSG